MPIPARTDGKRSWIFQSNPVRFDIICFLSTMNSGVWSVNQHRNQMAIGDKVYFWMSGKDAGIYGVGTILSLPRERIGDDENIDFGRYEVDVSVEKYLGEYYLPRTHFKINLILSNSKIMKFAQGTNFPLSDDEVTEIEQLLSLD